MTGPKRTRNEHKTHVLIHVYMRKRLMSLHDHDGDTVAIIQCLIPITRIPEAFYRVRTLGGPWGTLPVYGQM